MNVVDSCGWLEHLIGGSNSHFFEPILADQDRLLPDGHPNSPGYGHFKLLHLN